MDDSRRKAASKRQESLVADYLGWSVVSGSGARMMPGDVVSDSWLGECKTHVSCPVKIEFHADVWSKISTEGLSQFKRPVYFSDDGSQSLQGTWVLFSPIDTFEPINHVCQLKFSQTVKYWGTQLRSLLQDSSCPSVIDVDAFGGNKFFLTDISHFKQLLEIS